MLKKIFTKKNKIQLILSLVLIIIFSNNQYATSINNSNQYSMPEKIATVIGDSFAGYFSQDEGSELYNFCIFPVGGIDREVNQIIINDAIKNDTTGNILLATGVNDEYLTRVDVFDHYISALVQLAKKYDKRLFFHSYMKVFSLGEGEVNSGHILYDQVLRKHSKNNLFVTYIDLSNMNTLLYALKDGKHYDKMFYRTLKAKLKYEIHKYSNKNKDIWDVITKYDRMSVVGDKSAELFYNYEKNNGMNMDIHTNNEQSTSDNRNMISSALESQSKYLLLSLSEYDYNNQSNIDLFEATIRNTANVAMENRKIVFFHTYMAYPNSLLESKDISILKYDDILKKIANEYENIIYIDMTEQKQYNANDGIHYDKEFYDDLYLKIMDYIKQIPL